MTIGERIKARRIELKMSQRELSDKMGYASHSTVARVEKGEIDPPQSKIAKFAKILGVSPGHLMGWDMEPEDVGEAAADMLTIPGALELVRGYKALSNADRKTVLALVASMAEKTKKD